MALKILPYLVIVGDIEQLDNLVDIGGIDQEDQVPKMAVGQVAILVQIVVLIQCQNLCVIWDIMVTATDLKVK